MDRKMVAHSETSMDILMEENLVFHWVDEQVEKMVET
jgi:hypothetical protein